MTVPAPNRAGRIESSAWQLDDCPPVEKPPQLLDIAPFTRDAIAVNILKQRQIIPYSDCFLAALPAARNLSCRSNNLVVADLSRVPCETEPFIQRDALVIGVVQSIVEPFVALLFILFSLASCLNCYRSGAL